MESYNGLKTLADRRQFIDDLKLFVLAELPEKMNAFVFGSFLTEDFIPGQSDLDLALYADMAVDRIEIDAAISDWVAEKISIGLDIIWIDVLGKHNYIDIKPLQGYRLTAYFPKELVRHLAELVFALQYETEDRIRYRSMFDYALERSAMNGR